ncbi:XRE family transcriptional regulator [Corallococcus coralloides]|nr:XRE family transcriptional regulator [Corallococcus coralloides]
MKSGPKFTASSGNVFRDLEVAQPEEALAKAELVGRIADIIVRKKLTQAAAARLLGVDQPKVSALLRGRMAGFSTERLIRFLTLLGSDVQIVVRDRPRSRAPGHLEVITA